MEIVRSVRRLIRLCVVYSTHNVVDEDVVQIDSIGRKMMFSKESSLGSHVRLIRDLYVISVPR